MMNTLRRLLSTSLLLAMTMAVAGQTVSRVEYYWDVDPGRGHGTAITGYSAANQVSINTTISTQSLTPGVHTLGLRSRSSHGEWSAVTLRQVVVGQQVSRVEYVFDDDPGFGQGIAYPTTASGGTVTIDNANLTATNISNGLHRLGLRAQMGSNGQWSPTYWTTVLVNSAAVGAVEYFYDDDPAFGQGTAYTGFTPSGIISIDNAMLAADGVSDGLHRLGLRAKAAGQGGMWSPTYWTTVLVNSATVDAVEYFYDTDPAFGQGTAYTGFSPSGIISIDNAQLAADGVCDGLHRLGLRAKTAGQGGMWSPTYWTSVLVNSATVDAVEYFYDTDPAFGQGTAYTGFTPSGIISIDNAMLAADGVSDGLHRLGLRAKAAGQGGMWSPTYWTSVLVNSATVDAVEYFYDNDPAFGQGTAYTGFTPSGIISIDNAQLAADGVSDGLHRLGLRAKTAGQGGMWSPTYWTTVLVNSATVDAVEYFYDTDPAFGQGTAYTGFTPSGIISIDNAQLAADGVSDGLHRLGLRAKTAGQGGLWSPTYWTSVLVNGSGVAAVEYYWDDAHPALGQGIAYTAFAPSNTVVIDGTQLSTASLSTGLHRLALRARSGDGRWSPTYFHDVFVGSNADYAEYYWDSDPGYGMATPIAFTTGEDVMVNLNDIEVPTSDGLHILCLRARAGDMWSATYTKTYCNAPTPYFTIVGGDTVCQNQLFIVMDGSSKTSDQTLYWWDIQSDGTADYTTQGDILCSYNQPGTYQLQLGVGNNETCRNTYTREVTVRSIQNPTISIARSANNVCYGTEVVFTATTQRTEGVNPRIEWYRNDKLIVGATTDTVRLSDLNHGDRIRALVRVDNPCAQADSAWSSTLTMTIYSLPEISITQPRYVFTDEQIFIVAERFAATPAGGSYMVDGKSVMLFNPSAATEGEHTVEYTFANSNGCSSTASTTFVLMPRIEYTLTATTDDENSGTVSGSGTYTIGDTATLTATPALSYRFSHWGDGDTTNPRRIEMMSDSTVVAHWLRLCNDTLIVEDAEACDSYEWRGMVYIQSTDTARRDLTGHLGCDSTISLNLTLHHSNAAIENITACNNYVWHGRTFDQSDNTATFTTQNAEGCDSTTTLHLTINHCSRTDLTACDEFEWHNNVYTESGIYVDGNDTLYLTLRHSSQGTESITTCDNYTWHGRTFDQSVDTATYHSVNAADCDSTTTLLLTITHSTAGIEVVSACDSYTWYGRTFGQSVDTATHHSINAVGCDSLTTLHLTIKHSTEAIAEATACDNYTWHDRLFVVSTDTATHHSINAVGCDSLTTLHLTLQYSNDGEETVTACDSYTWHGRTFSQSVDTATHHSINTVGCDSTTTLRLTIEYSTQGVQTVTACDSYTWHGRTFDQSADTATHHSLNAKGCDSTTTLLLTIAHSTAGTVEATACDSYVWHGRTFDQSSDTATHHSLNAEGCDSTTTLHLTMHYSTEGEANVTACNNYVWYGREFTESVDTATIHLLNAASCDSLTTLHLVVEECSITTITACDSYQWHGALYTTSGTYVDDGDTLLLTLRHSSATIEEITACDSTVWHGRTFYAPTDTATYHSYNAEACDSLTTLHLTLQHSTASEESVVACDSYTWNGQLFTQSVANATQHSTNAAGCDSASTLHLTVHHSNEAVESITACNSYTWHGREFTASTDTATFSTLNADGCDSVVTLHLTLNACSTTSVVACDSYEWEGMTYTLGGLYTHGNDTLNLTIRHSSEAVESITACNSYTWHGREFSASTDTATYHTLNADGCDSVVTLHLTLNACSNTSVVACNSYEWNGTTYTTSGLYTHDYDTLSLTIRHSSEAVESITACNSYTWHGREFSASTDTATYRTINADGCDSVVTLHLTINACSSSAIMVEACDSYEWHGTTYTTSGTYADGNDTLVLTLHYSSHSEESVTVGTPYLWQGHTYAQSGTYHDTLTSAYGCDSIVTLHLTVTQMYHITVSSSDLMKGTVYGAGDYPQDTTIAIGAQPSEHYHFVQWSDGNTSNPRMVTVTGNMTFEAIFAIDQHTVSITSNDMMMGTVTGSGTYDYGTQATATALPNSGYTFLMWDDSSTHNPYTFTVLGDVTRVAIFSKEVGIDEVEALHVELYPNPTTDIVNIAADGLLRVEVYDNVGRLVSVVDEDTPVDLTGLSSGTYSLRLVLQQGTIVRKVVKR